MIAAVLFICLCLAAALLLLLPLAVVIAIYCVCAIALGLLLFSAPDLSAAEPVRSPAPDRYADPTKVIGGSGAGSSASYLGEVDGG